MGVRQSVAATPERGSGHQGIPVDWSSPLFWHLSLALSRDQSLLDLLLPWIRCQLICQHLVRICPTLAATETILNYTGSNSCNRRQFFIIKL